jgi:hypothetical protein
MRKWLPVCIALLGLVLAFAACGKSQPAPAGEAAAAPAAERAAAPVAAPAGMKKIGDMSEAWNALYKQNEKVINDYQGMPIMGLVTPALNLAVGVQFDLLNLGDRDGRFEGKLMLAGYPAFEEKAGPKITFGYDDTLQKDGFGPAAKAGDRVAASGSLALDTEHYVCETFTERAGRKVARSHTEFKRLADGSMICLDMNGHLFDMRGDENPGDEAIYLHNGPGRYDFVIARAKTGPEFKTLSFAGLGDLDKAQALELLKSSGYEIESSGGIQGGKLVVDPK